MNLEKKVSWFHRLDTEFYYLLLLNLTVSLACYETYTSNWVIFQLTFLLFILFLLFLKRSRIIYKLEFDDINQKLDIHYFHFIAYSKSVTIPYENIKYKYYTKSYGIGNLMKALVFLSSNKFVAEIPRKNRAGWSKDEISDIINMLNKLDLK